MGSDIFGISGIISSGKHGFKNGKIRTLKNGSCLCFNI